jgi:DNA-binding SARP family transcriptional activator
LLHVESSTDLVEPVSPFEDQIVIDLTTTSDDASIRLQLLGAYRIHANGVEVTTGLRSKARELLALLALRPDGVTAEYAIDSVLPDADPARGASHLHTLLNNLRSTLRNAAGLDDSTPIIERAGNRYRLNRGVVDVDTWRFDTALRSALQDDTTKAARQQAAELYRGDLLDGEFFAWIEGSRQDIRRRALDNLTILSDLLDGHDEADAAIAALEQAITIDPYSETTYQQLAALQRRHGRTDAAARTLDLLEHRMRDLDTELT